MRKLTIAQRAILLEAGRAFRDASWNIVAGQVALSHDRKLEADVTVDVREEPDAYDLTAIQEMLQTFGNDLTAMALE